MAAIVPYHKSRMTADDIRGMSLDTAVIEEFVSLITFGDDVYYENLQAEDGGLEMLTGKKPHGTTYQFIINQWGVALTPPAL